MTEEIEELKKEIAKQNMRINILCNQIDFILKKIKDREMKGGFT